MNCQDTTCIFYKTCKWDSSVSKVYCENTYYVEPEPVDYLKRDTPIVTYVEPSSQEEGVHLPVKQQETRKPRQGGYQWT